MRRITHPVALLRYVLGPDMTQQRFGAYVGVSGSYIRAVENHQRPITDSLGKAIEAKFGLPRHLLGNPIGEMDSRSFKAAVSVHLLLTWLWASISQLVNDDAMNALKGLFGVKLFELVDCAQRCKRAPALLMSLDEWIDKAVKEFRLEKVWAKTGATFARYISFPTAETSAANRSVHKAIIWKSQRYQFNKEPDFSIFEIPIPPHLQEFLGKEPMRWPLPPAEKAVLLKALGNVLKRMGLNATGATPPLASERSSRKRVGKARASKTGQRRAA